MKKRLGFFLGSLAIGTVFWVGIISVDAATTVQSMYRLYNPNTGEHFYTADKTEQQDLIVKGWTDEEIGWIAPESGDTVYRIYNPNVGEHLYTKSLKEYNKLALNGWVKEGTAFYSASSSGVPIYRVYNSNQFAFNHHYTKSEKESKYLTQLGWSDEGIAFYGMNDSATPETSTVTINYVDTAGNKIKDSATESVEVGKDFTTTAPDISGYTIQGETSQTLTNVTSNQTITFTYQKNGGGSTPVTPTKNYTVKVNYVDANDPTKTVIDATTETVKEGDSFTAPVIADYTVNNQKPTSKVITEDTSVTFEYVSNTTIFKFTTSDNDSVATIIGFVSGQEGNEEADIPQYVVYDGVVYPVTTIGNGAFYKKYLTSVIIPDSVTTIEEGAFLENSLVKVSIPNKVTTIGSAAFKQNRLESVTIPASVISIEMGAFSNNKLTSITIPNSVISIGNYTFYSNQLSVVTIPDSVQTIGNSAFYNNTNLTNASIPAQFKETYGNFFQTPPTTVTVRN